MRSLALWPSMFWPNLGCFFQRGQGKFVDDECESKYTKILERKVFVH